MNYSNDPREMAEILRGQARAYEAAARRTRRLADKIEHPPEGVRVQIDGGRGLVQFIGPEIKR